jgi:hypothetical protein
MDAHTEQITGELYLFGFPKAPARVTVARHEPGARAGRAVKALLALWGIAALTILVPIAHFVLVPGFFITGIVVGLRRLNEPATVMGVSGACPRCGSERGFEAGGRLKASSKVSCLECHNQLDLAIDPAFVRGA